MSLVFKDRVKVTSTTTGTGTFTLGSAVTGFQALASTDNGQIIPYTIEAVDGSGVPTGEWETGFGTYTHAGTTLARTRVTASSNSGNAVNFGAGTKNVFLTPTASTVQTFILIGESIALPAAMA